MLDSLKDELSDHSQEEENFSDHSQQNKSNLSSELQVLNHQNLNDSGNQTIEKVYSQLQTIGQEIRENLRESRRESRENEIVINDL